MKAAVLREFGSDFVIEEKEIRGKGIKVKVKACGICGRDLVIWRGGFKNFQLPAILGHEVYGIHDNKPYAIYPNIYCGECIYCKSGKENLCERAYILGEGVPGGYAEEVLVDERNLIPLPENDFVKYSVAEPIATAIHSSKVANIRIGEKVLVTGASGGVGIHAVQYLKAIGADVYGLTSKPEVVESVGVEAVSLDDIKKMKFDVVFEIVGAKTINDSLRALKKEGRLVLIGNVEGEEIVLSRPALTIMRQQSIIGSASYTKREYEEAIEAVRRRLIKPVYTAYNFLDINRAYREIVSGKAKGRAVLVF
jgi:D-arabinose 1-dehydrogenase-like Zn-dependent alcohol dehydrogenase